MEVLWKSIFLKKYKFIVANCTQVRENLNSMGYCNCFKKKKKINNKNFKTLKSFYKQEFRLKFLSENTT